MQIKEPKNTEKYLWTRHVFGKMRQYGISEQMVKRIIRSPERTEKGIAPGTTAVMQTRGQKKKHEVWVMYIAEGELKNKTTEKQKNKNRIKIITTWRYPGISPVRDQIPIPADILEELNELV